VISAERAKALVGEGARIRVRSGGIGCEHVVMAEGRVIAYCPAPSLVIEHADGTRSSWSVDLPVDVLGEVAE
jgi:hypothetical protein